MLYNHPVSFLFPYVHIRSLSSLFCLCFCCWWLHQLHRTSSAAPAAALLQHLGVSAAAGNIWFSYHHFIYDMSLIISSSFIITPSYHIISSYIFLMIFHHMFYHFIISSHDFSISTSSLLTFIVFILFVFIIIFISIIIIFHLPSSPSPSYF
jgi:hypothetical protein